MLTEQTVYIMKKRSCGEDLNAPGEKTKKKKVPDFSRTFLGWLRTLILIPMQPGSSLVGATGCSPRQGGVGGCIDPEGGALSPMTYIPCLANV